MSITRTLILTAAIALGAGACGDDTIATDVDELQLVGDTDTPDGKTTAEEPQPALLEEGGAASDGDTSGDASIVVEPDARLDWPVAPIGSGCAPGALEVLPDGEWWGYAHGLEDGGLVFDLVCAWDPFDLAEAGLIEEPPSPNLYVVNDSEFMRSLPVAADAVAEGGDAEFAMTSMTFSDWAEPHASWAAQVTCPSELCFGVITVTDGLVTGLIEVYQS